MTTTTDLKPAHKAAMAQGRTESRVVREYLEGLEANKPRRGRRRTPEQVEKQLGEVIETLATSNGDLNVIKRLELEQRRMDLASELETMGDGVDLTDLQERFMEVAKGYSERKGISYAAWRKIGVSAAVLKDAGIKRSS